MLRAARPHLIRPGLAFPNPPSGGSKIRPAIHSAQPKRLRGVRLKPLSAVTKASFENAHIIPVIID